MSEEKVDVAIVSVFGRGNWLASELARRGSKTVLIDVSSAFAAALAMSEGEAEGLAPADQKRAAPADDAYVDAEGPFGFFETPFSSDSQKQRLFDDGEAGEGGAPSAAQASRGACFWPPGGPIEGRSELTAYQIRARGIAPEVERYLRWPELLSAEKSFRPRRSAWERAASRERARLERLPFASKWLAALAHQATAAVYFEAPDAIASGANLPTPLLSAFWTRRVSAAGATRALAACAAAGVRVVAGASLSGLRLSGRAVGAVEAAWPESTPTTGRGSASVAGQREAGGCANVIEAHAFVWSLTGAETHFAFANVGAALFADGPAQVEWRWLRARFAVRDTAAFRALPSWTALLSDPFLPWTHENLAIWRKLRGDVPGQAPQQAPQQAPEDTAREAVAELDIWLRLPSARATANPEYARAAFDRASAILAERLPGSDPRLLSLSREARAGRERPAMQPVFVPESLGRATRLRSPNLLYDGPETWETLDWNGAYGRQADILDELEAMRAQREALAAKEAARALRQEQRAAAKAAKKMAAAAAKAQAEAARASKEQAGIKPSAAEEKTDNSPDSEARQ
jgi:hypothetical protein